jgi:hypothetical protein
MRRHNKEAAAVVEVKVAEAPVPEGAMAEVLAAVTAPIPTLEVTKIAEAKIETIAVAATIPEQEPVKVRRFRVMRERPYVDGGMRCILREGSIVDTATRDIELLRKQGVPLEELAE